MEPNHKKDEIEIDLIEISRVLWSKKWIIIFIGIVLALCAGIVTKVLITEQYQSSTEIYVINRNEDTSLSYSDLQIGSQLANDYRVLVSNKTVLDQVISQLDLSVSSAELSKMIRVDILTNTRIIKITVTNPDPYLAREIATAVRVVASDHISQIMKVEALSIVSEANLPTSPSTPNVKKNTLFAGIIGVILSAFIILLLFFLDDTIKKPEDVERYLDTVVLGTIPVKDSDKGRKQVKNKKNGEVKVKKSKEGKLEDVKSTIREQHE